MEFRALGKLEVVRDGHVVDLGAFLQRALFGLPVDLAELGVHHRSDPRVP